MKPLRLVLQAFGPYADQQDFDFRELGDHTFFLIHGDTGAGKSTILDALCYALYGDSSGGDRTGLQLRSHHAPQFRPTTVLFDFAIGSNHYRVTRSPELERPKRRGTGTITSPQSARLWLRNGCNNDDEPGEILAERWEQVNCRVIELLGFECSQFRQVVVLPQGKFRDFLVAPSGEREAILSVLFKTDEFETIERALKNTANQIKRKYDQQKQRLNDLFEYAAVKDMSALLLHRKQRVVELEYIKEQVDTLRVAADEAQQELHKGQETHRLFTKQTQAEQVVAQLNAQQDEMKAYQAELDRGHRAATILDVEVTLGQRLAEEHKASSEREEARQSYDAALAAQKQARYELIQAEQREPDIAKTRQQVTQLQEIVSRIGELEEARTKLDTVEQQAQVIALQYLDLKDSLDSAEADLQALNLIVTTSRNTVAQREDYLLRFESSSRLNKQRERLDIVITTLDAAQQAEQHAAQNSARTRSKYEQGREQIEQIEHTWYVGQAGLLAQNLIAGSPCPVCGAVEHPLPAPAALNVLTETDLKHQRDVQRKHEKAWQDALTVLAEKQTALADIRAEHTTLVETLGEYRSSALVTLHEAFKKATDDLEVVQAACEALPEQEKKLSATLVNVATLKEQMASLNRAHIVVTNAVETARAIAFERERVVPAHLRTRAAIENTLAATQKLLEQQCAAFEQARKQNGEAEAAVAATQATWTTRVETSRQAQQRTHEQGVAFKERLVNQGFADPETYYAAKRPVDALQLLGLRIAAHEQDYTIAVNSLSEAAKAVEGLILPEITILTAAAEQSRKSHEGALQLQASLREQLAQYVKWCDEAEQLSVGLEQLQHQYLVIGDIARIANGDNAYRMSFQRFVLAALLDEVLINASHRLQTMSRGRYKLQRALEQHDRRLAGGLELEVLDFFTGRARLAKTLSGGESFLASLALALGLADVVQARTGGIHLETMFVDEGFGSLDERTLDQAIQTLSDLQHSGRLIGIISHVTELQCRIAARLEVQSSPSGSTARFVIGSTS